LLFSETIWHPQKNDMTPVLLKNDYLCLAVDSAFGLQMDIPLFFD